MNRIKSIEDVILAETEVLMEMVEGVRQSGIVIPGKDLSKDQSPEYGVIVAKGASVKDLDVGDIVLKTRVASIPSYTYKERELGIISRHNIVIAVKAANFDNSENSEITS
jgi:co-chaperonin GroES (HSP10)